MRSLVAIGLVLAAHQAAVAEPCVTLAGDDQLIATVHELLDARGIAVDTTEHCRAVDLTPVSATIVRQGDLLLVGIAPPDGVPVERAVNGVHTAATVIESWVRTDVGAPLLEIHAVPHDVDPLSPSTQLVRLPPSKHVVHLFAGAETSLGLDRTEWYGAQVGACVMLGPICAAARMRVGQVGEGPGHWGGNLQREDVELLIGVDVPIRVATRVTLTPGFGAGFGATHTHMEGMMHVGSESSGLRAAAHATLSYPLTRHLAIDISLTADLTQETSMEESAAILPGEPRALFRFGAGVRYLGRLDEDP